MHGACVPAARGLLGSCTGHCIVAALGQHTRCKDGCILAAQGLQRRLFHGFLLATRFSTFFADHFVIFIVVYVLCLNFNPPTQAFLIAVPVQQYAANAVPLGNNMLYLGLRNRRAVQQLAAYAGLALCNHKPHAATCSKCVFVLQRFQLQSSCTQPVFQLHGGCTL